MKPAIKTILLCLWLLPTISNCFAQADAFTGTWQLIVPATPATSEVQLNLQIGQSEKSILYPAQLSIKCDSLQAVYLLLLVKKSSRELAISRNKFALSEIPYSMGAATFYLNGWMDISRDIKGNATLTLNRIQELYNKVHLPDTSRLNPVNKRSALQLFSFLQKAPVQFVKINANPWNNSYTDRMLDPAISPGYFGLLDTITVPVRDAAVLLTSPGKNDVATLAINGRIVLDKVMPGKKGFSDEVLLDTGLNIVALFAENFAAGLPNKTKTRFEFGEKKILFNLDANSDSAAVFIAARVVYAADRQKETSIKDYTPGLKTALAANEKLVGSLLTNSRQLTLAVWDDAVEDGDSISIQVNNQWVQQKLRVKKNPQFIVVTLQPGNNDIVFMGENLGTIPPNTAVLEIIDGKKHRSYMLETVPGENNILKIQYDTGTH